MGGPSAPTAYQPANSAAVDAAYTQTLDQNSANTTSLWSYAQPAYTTAVNNVTNNPYNAQAQAGANSVSAQSTPIGLDQIARGNQTAGLGPSIIQAGFDPQSALRNYNYGQTVNGAQATAAQSGLAGSPFGAGMVNDAANQFNMNWQAGAQQRQGQAVTQLAANDASANASQAQGLRTQTEGAALPQANYNSQQAQTFTALNQLVAALTAITGSNQANASGDAQYLATGQNATSVNQNAAKINSAGGGLLGGLGSIFGLSTGGGGTVGGDGLASLATLFA